MKKAFLSLLTTILILTLSSCVSTSENKTDKPTPTQSEASTSTQPQSSDALENEADATTLSWPVEHMKDLPVPKGTVSKISKYLDMKYLTPEDTTIPNLIIVEVSDMTKEDAASYVQQLKDLGFSGGLSVSDDENIAFSGVGTNSDAPNGINFTYVIDTKTATISY